MLILELGNPLDDIYENDKTYEFFNINKDVNISTYIIHNFWINYQNKPHELEYISPYEFANNYFNVNSTQYYWFLENHPQKHTLTLHKYNMLTLCKVIKYHHTKMNLKIMLILFAFCSHLENLHRYKKINRYFTNANF